jgi:RNA polymerase sigma factor (sigma-70 family)
VTAVKDREGFPEPESEPEFERGLDAQMLGELHDLYALSKDSIVAGMLFITHNKPDAEDATQEAFAALVRVWRQRRHLPTNDNVRYVYGIAAHKAVDCKRRVLSWARALVRLGPLADPVGDVEQVVIDRELSRDAARRIAQLPRGQRAIAVLYLIAGMTPADIAAHLHANPSTVRTQLQTALVRLRAELRDQHEQIVWKEEQL